MCNPSTVKTKPALLKSYKSPSASLNEAFTKSFGNFDVMESQGQVELCGVVLAFTQSNTVCTSSRHLMSDIKILLKSRQSVHNRSVLSFSSHTATRCQRGQRWACDILVKPLLFFICNHSALFGGGAKPFSTNPFTVVLAGTCRRFYCNVLSSSQSQVKGVDLIWESERQVRLLDSSVPSRGD